MKHNLPSKQKGFISFSAIKSFFQFSNVSVYIIIGLVAIYGYYRINMLEAENETLETKNVGLNEEVEETKKDYNDLATDINDFRKQINEDLKEQSNITEDIREQRNDNQQKIQRLEELFNESSSGEERDFENLARQKPDMIEKRINEGTREFGNSLEEIFNIDSESNDSENDDQTDDDNGGDNNE